MRTVNYGLNGVFSYIMRDELHIGINFITDASLDKTMFRERHYVIENNKVCSYRLF